MSEQAVQEKTEAPNALRIIRMEANNVKRLKAVAIEPQPDGTVIISGKNGQGKTSVLDSIWWALAGARNITDNPVNDDATEASVKLELGKDGVEYIVVRRFSEDGKSKLEITGPDGLRLSSKQTFLDGLIGELSFDPLAFSGMSGKEQRETLLSLVDFPIDLDKIDSDREKAYQERRDLNRDIKSLEGEVSGMRNELESDDTFDDVDSIPDEVPGVNQFIDKEKELNRLEQHTDHLIEELGKIQGYIVRAEQQAEVCGLSWKLGSMAEEIRGIEEAFEGNKPDISERAERLREEIDNAQDINKLVSEKQRLIKLQERLSGLKEQSDALTKKIENLDETKATVLSEADLPVDGLGFSPDGVTYDGQPWEQVESSAQLRISTAVAMELNPGLRILRIKEGSLLDEDNLSLLNDMAKEHGFQVWIEVVDSTGGLGIVIEDGSVKKVNE